MKMRSVAPMRAAKIGYIVMSVFFCIIGIWMIVYPQISMQVMAKVLGMGLLLFGCIRLIGYLSKDLFRLAFQYDLEFGILLILLGLIVLIKPGNVVNFIFIAIGIAVFTEGLFKVQIALDAKRFGIETWWLIFALAVVTALAGGVIMFRPAAGAQMMTVLLGISLLTEGILNFCVVLSTVKIVKHQQPDVVECEYYEIK